MSELGFGTHLAIFLALVVNLWFGGDIVEVWLGGARLAHVVRSVLEIALIGAWLILVVGMRAPFPWRRPKPEDDEGEKPR